MGGKGVIQGVDALCGLRQKLPSPQRLLSTAAAQGQDTGGTNEGGLGERKKIQ